MEVDPGPDGLERDPMVLAALEDAAEDGEQRQRRHAQPVGPGPPGAGLVDEGLADVEDDGLDALAQAGTPAAAVAVTVVDRRVEALDDRRELVIGDHERRPEDDDVAVVPSAARCRG